jgi:hypothetical protein
MKVFSLLAAASLLALSGCASVSVRNVQRRAVQVAPPAVIWVADYDTTGGSWKITSRTRTEEQYKQELSQRLASELAADLQAYLKVPVQRVRNPNALPPNGWLVTGRFTRVSEGSPVGRIVVGLGAGATKLETETIVQDGRLQGPFLRFATTGGSNAAPGALVTVGPGGVILNGATQATRGIKDDAERTSRMITASLAEYATKSGWLPASRLKAKREGEFQFLQPQGR